MHHSPHHGDGQQLPTEALPQLNPWTCPHARCSGLMLQDADDPTELKCVECCRSTFRPVIAGLAQERDNEGHVHSHRGLTGRSTKARDVGPPQGRISPVIRRFA